MESEQTKSSMAPLLPLCTHPRVSTIADFPGALVSEVAGVWKAGGTWGVRRLVRTSDPSGRPPKLVIAVDGGLILSIQPEEREWQGGKPARAYESWILPDNASLGPSWGGLGWKKIRITPCGWIMGRSEPFSESPNFLQFKLHLHYPDTSPWRHLSQSSGAFRGRVSVGVHTSDGNEWVLISYN
jgi:hypothetical protein